MPNRKMFKKLFQGLGILCGLLQYFQCFAIADKSGKTPVVETKLGKLTGTTVDVNGTLVNQYLGVPYAKPPTGEFRFKKPRKLEAWENTIKATEESPACIQYNQAPYPWYDDKPGKSEDCLYLNIWTPFETNTSNPKAVLYWMYGGGFFLGSIRMDLYKGHLVSALGDIIVVTVNYRLGSFGFLFSNTDDAPGNVGIWDILTGLQWVNENIEAFGGDVSRITIAGESAGSIAAGLLSVSPLARGLYKRQIMESGSPAYTNADNNTQNLDRSQLLAELVGCANERHSIVTAPSEVVKCLREIDAMDLIKAEASIDPYSTRSFIPQWGDALLPKNPRVSIIEGNFQDNEVLLGNNGDEGSFQVAVKYIDTFGFFGEKDPHINNTFGEDLIREIFAKFSNTEGVVKHYLPDNITEDQHELIRQQVYTASGDFSLLCPTVYFAERYAEKGNNVYFYLWDHRPSTTRWAPWMGAAHFSEVQFVFGDPLKHPHNYEPEEVHLSSQLIEYWTNFVKNGKPSESWPLYSKSDPQFKLLSLKNKEKGSGPNRNNCDFFRPYFGFVTPDVQSCNK
ncbi:acetylcholinesterase-1-like isoform X2 [Stegodyphus dumicola]|uniref:acetylcholinesterase-1-like isoform X2 n=1 Tax=Stegodyphus dumicola TaxID=202533 RepID=UPI0015AEA2DD|nr:acetylcholinesterase-1-like isoform X2 [Stegodyphus dumicola]